MKMSYWKQQNKTKQNKTKQNKTKQKRNAGDIGGPAGGAGRLVNQRDAVSPSTQSIYECS